MIGHGRKVLSPGIAADQARQRSKIYNTLKAHRRALGLTQAALAERIGVSRKTINTIENSVFTPSVGLALALARSMGVKVEDLFTLESGDF